MDNKQNREFYWELKQFLNCNKLLKESSSPKQESLKDSIKKMLVQGNPLHNPAPTHKFIAEEFVDFSKDTISEAVKFISNSEVELNKGKSDCKAFTSNITENLFSIQKKYNKQLNEGDEKQFKDLDWRREQEKKSMAHEIEMEELRKKRREQKEERERQKREEKANKDTEYYTKESQRYESETGKKLDITNASDLDTLKKWRYEKTLQRKAEKTANDLETLVNKDPSQLTDLEKVKLKLAQQELKNTEVRQRVSQRLSTGPQPQGPTPTGGNLGDDLISKAMGLGTEALKLTPARIVEPDNNDTRISGSSMTYGQFNALTGRRYDAFSDLDRKIVINMAGAGKITPGNYDPNKMSEGEAGFMTGANYGYRANERERTANAAAFRQQDAAARQRELENTPEYQEAQKRKKSEERAALEASVAADLAKEYGVDINTFNRARKAGVSPRDLANQSITQTAPKQTQSVVNSFKAPAAMKNQMTQSPRSSMVPNSRVQITPGSRKSIDAQLKKLRGL